jgi:predicted thioesterase
MAIEKGLSAEAQTLVDESLTAATMGSGSLEVYATPALVALMEEAACAAIADELEDGQTSVGTRIDIEHVAASPLEAMVSAIATVTEVEGRRIDFELSAYENEKLIGRGKHSRFLVDAERFMAKLEKSTD